MFYGLDEVQEPQSFPLGLIGSGEPDESESTCVQSCTSSLAALGLLEARQPTAVLR